MYDARGRVCGSDANISLPVLVRVRGHWWTRGAHHYGYSVAEHMCAFLGPTGDMRKAALCVVSI